MASLDEYGSETSATKIPRLSDLGDGFPTNMAGLPNPHLSTLDKDFLYHIGYFGHECKEKFHDVKVLNFFLSKG